MLLTPLSSAITQYVDGDSSSSTSKMLLVAGATAIPGVVRPIKVTAAGRIELDGASNRTALNVFAEAAAVISTSETTVVSYTATAVLTVIQGVLVTGQAAGRFKLKVDGVTKTIVRTTAAKTTEQFQFEDGIITATAGQVILITGFHELIANQALAGNLFGYEVN